MRARSATIVLAIATILISLGTLAPGARAAGPTLTIASPADNAVVGNGTPVVVIFVVSNFNLTPPGTAGSSSAPNVGHVDVYVDGVWTMTVSQQTIVLRLPSGVYTIVLRLVSDNGTALSPEVSSSIRFTVTQGPAVGTPRIDVSYVEITDPIPDVVLNDDVTISFRITDFVLVPPGRGQYVPNEGHVAVFVDGVYNKAVVTFEPVPFSDLPDGLHTVMFRLVDDAGRPLTPDASDSVTFRIQNGPVVDINPSLSISQVVLAFAILGVLFYRGWGRNALATLYARIGGRKP